MPTLFLRNIEQVALYELELKGQLSDGRWENARPYDHWKPWCRAKAAIEPHGLVGRNFSILSRDRYATASKALLKVVGGRMLGQVRLVRAFGMDIARELEPSLGCDEDYEVSWHAPLTEFGGTYWDKRRETLANFALAGITDERIQAALQDESYGKRELVKDLKEIGKAMQTYVNASDPVQGG